MQNSLEVIGLEDLGVVRIRGIDAVRFLQGYNSQPSYLREIITSSP